MLRKLINRVVLNRPTTRSAQRKRLQAWIAALRSGKYEQSKFGLRDDVGFCCLGVACEISGLGIWQRSGSSDFYTYATPASTERSLLPSDVAEYFGVDVNPIVDKDIGFTAVTANDGRGMDFVEIANALEESYL